MRKFTISILACLLALPLFAQTHTSRFEMTEDFLKSWSASPVRDVEAKIDCAGPVHDPTNDCEMHIGAAFTDPSFTDFPNVVLEPPNLCKDPKKPTRATINALAGDECTANGFVRAWPEHLTSGSGCSNPNHFLEVHPMVTMKCGSKSFDFTPKLRAFADLGHKAPATVEKMMDMQFWVCRGCSAEEGMLAFDYCFGDPCKAGQASNFAQMKVEIIRSTIRPAVGKTLDDVATVIARVQPDPASPRVRPMKLYAVKGTKFYDDLLAEREKTGTAPKLKILGIFTLDPFSVVRALENKQFKDDEWTSVPHPVSLIVFGSL